MTSGFHAEPRLNPPLLVQAEFRRRALRWGMARWCCALLLLAALPASAAMVDYRFAFDPDPGALRARVCTAAGAAVRTFGAGDDAAPKFVSEVARTSGAAVEQQDGSFRARDWKAGECLTYRVDLEAVAAERGLDRGAKVGGDYLSSASLWMLRPRALDREPDAEVAFEIPAGWSLSVPWAPLDDAPHRRFRVGSTSPMWPTMVAIGRFTEEQLVAGTGRVRLAILGDLDAATRDKLHAFVLASATDVAISLPNVFAVAPQLVLIPVPARRDAVPFGLSVRGGGQGVMVLVNPQADPKQLDRAWTLTHELVHVVHPHLGPDGRWISEGIATYYQNVLRARNGRLTAQEAWDELDSGFARGRADKSGLSLVATSEEMDEGHHYMRGYWSGAALMLRADLALRTRKENPTTLDAALNTYLDCCRASEKGAEVGDFLAALDRAVGGHTFVTLFRELANSSDFPDLKAEYATLGIESRPDHVARDEDPRRVALRMAIMGKD